MKAVCKFLIFIVVSICILYSSAVTQEWSQMDIIMWENSPGNPFGYYNPSYCSCESLLYFDTYGRLSGIDMGKLYSTKLDSIDQYGYSHWSDPIELPEPINLEGFINAMPSISNSGDSLFFSSDRPGTMGAMDIWMSIRSNGVWGEPVNLDSPVNTTDNEQAPHYSSNLGLLFFEKYVTSAFLNIYMCEYLGNNNWSIPTILPEIINVPGEYTFGPFFDETNEDLYYSNLASDITPVKKIPFLNGIWGDPETLSENVNGFWAPNYCDRVLTSDASISSDGNMLFYGKEIWEASFCFDFSNHLFISRKLNTDIMDGSTSPKNLQITVYPNPSNEKFRFLAIDFEPYYKMEIYNIEGKLIRRFKTIKTNIFDWDCKNKSGNIISSGIYFTVITDKKNTRLIKLTYLK